MWLRSIKYGSLGGKAEWRYSGLKVLMKSYLKLLFKCNTNRGSFTGYLAERVECGPSNHVVGGSIPGIVTFRRSLRFGRAGAFVSVAVSG